tara:strand:- start:170 stop:1456 length:1287 start_codon:yes stop_codon:yes gene_type:complete
MENYADIVKLHYEYFKNTKNYKKHIPSNLKEIEKYSDKDSIVFENNNELVIAMRGLQPGRSRDDVVIGTEIFFEDAYQQSGSDFETSTAKKKGISLLPNKYGEILIKEQKKIDDLKKEYPNKKIVLAGHSRGGRKAIDLGEHNQLEYHAFQPAEMNRMGQTALGIVGGSVIPTGAAFRGNIEREIFQNVMNQPQGVMSELLTEFGDIQEIEKNILSSAIGSTDITSSIQRLLGKTLIPRMVDRTVDMATGYDPLRRPSDTLAMRPTILKRELVKQEFPEDFRVTGDEESKLKKLIEPTLTYLTGKGREKRKAPTESIANIYKTENDRVSKGYQHTELVKPKQYAYGVFDHYLLGDHSIDHFISKEMFDSISENRPIEIIEEVEINSLEPVISQPSITQPSSTIGYTVDNISLCKKYPNYSPQCKKILR